LTAATSASNALAWLAELARWTGPAQNMPSAWWLLVSCASMD
jgi:hypothetical protein